MTVANVGVPIHVRRWPEPRAVLELLKPVTWFPPMWAFSCGVVASGRPWAEVWPTWLAGICLTGPLVCAASQAANDWFDREVDAVNEPRRPIPSGRVPGAWGLWIAIAWSAMAVAFGALLGPWGAAGTAAALASGWAYSAPPLRLKRNGWWSNLACGMSYEGLAWLTGTAVALGAFPDARGVALAALYSLGAHGILTLNDFKSVDGDVRFGVGSLPARLGVQRAARVACAAMAGAQVAVVALLAAWERPLAALLVAALLGVQLWMMRRFLRAPRERALWLSAGGVPFYVLGMLASAFALRAMRG